MEKVRLGDVCTVVSGSTPKTNNPEYWNGDINWITPAELADDSYIINESARKITEEGVRKTGLKSFPAGTVILSSRAPIGKVAIAGTEMYCNQGFKNLICSEKINSDYLYWFLKSNTTYLNSLGRGATFKEISKSIVENIRIPLPSLSEQEECALSLKKIRDIQSLKKSQLEQLDNLIKSRFVEMFGSIYDTNVKWETDLLKNLLTIERGGSPRPIDQYITQDENGVNWIKIGDTRDNSIYIDTCKEKIKPEGMKKSRYVSKGDLLLSNSMSFGRPYILNIDGCIHDGWLVLKDEKNIFDKIFLCYLLGSNETYNMFKAMAEGGVVSNLNKELVGKLRVTIPNRLLQDEFSHFVEQVDKSKFDVQKSIEELQTLYDSLMQKYFG